MAATLLTICNSNLIHGSRKQHPWHPSLFLGVGMKILEQPCAVQRNSKKLQHYQTGKLSHRFLVFAATEGSTKSSESEETIPSWARPDSNEPPPWARDEGAKEKASSQEGFAVPFYVYLLASAITAIAAIGSVFEYVNQNPVFGVLNSDSIFYAPLLGFFAFTGVPTSAFLWFKSVEAANKEAEEQDRRDGYL